MFDRILNATLPNNYLPLHQKLTTFPGIFDDIPQDIWRHCLECLATLPGIFGNIPQNVWRHSPEYNIPHIPRVPRIPFPVPVFLVLYVALLLTSE